MTLDQFEFDLRMVTADEDVIQEALAAAQVTSHEGYWMCVLDAVKHDCRTRAEIEAWCAKRRLGPA